MMMMMLPRIEVASTLPAGPPGHYHVCGSPSSLRWRPSIGGAYALWMHALRPRLRVGRAASGAHSASLVDEPRRPSRAHRVKSAELLH